MWNIPIVNFEFVSQSITKGSLIAHNPFVINALVVVCIIPLFYYKTVETKKDVGVIVSRH